MMRLEHIVPTEMKRAEIITLHKGDKKRNDDPNNYRVITFLSVTLELNELVLLSHCEIHVFLKSLNMQQGKFQKQFWCNMSSSILRETLHHARDESAKVFVCCLDGTQAFDNVWHFGRFYKLLELNIAIQLSQFVICTRTLFVTLDIADCSRNHFPCYKAQSKEENVLR